MPYALLAWIWLVGMVTVVGADRHDDRPSLAALQEADMEINYLSSRGCFYESTANAFCDDSIHAAIVLKQFGDESCKDMVVIPCTSDEAKSETEDYDLTTLFRQYGFGTGEPPAVPPLHPNTFSSSHQNAMIPVIEQPRYINPLPNMIGPGQPGPVVTSFRDQTLISQKPQHIPADTIRNGPQMYLFNQNPNNQLSEPSSLPSTYDLNSIFREYGFDTDKKHDVPPTYLNRLANENVNDMTLATRPLQYIDPISNEIRAGQHGPPFRLSPNNQPQGPQTPERILPDRTHVGPLRRLSTPNLTNQLPESHSLPREYDLNSIFQEHGFDTDKQHDVPPTHLNRLINENINDMTLATRPPQYIDPISNTIRAGQHGPPVRLSPNNQPQGSQTHDRILPDRTHVGPLRRLSTPNLTNQLPESPSLPREYDLNSIFQEHGFDTDKKHDVPPTHLNRLINENVNDMTLATIPPQYIDPISNAIRAGQHGPPVRLSPNNQPQGPQTPQRIVAGPTIVVPQKRLDLSNTNPNNHLSEPLSLSRHIISKNINDMTSTIGPTKFINPRPDMIGPGQLEPANFSPNNQRLDSQTPQHIATNGMSPHVFLSNPNSNNQFLDPSQNTIVEVDPPMPIGNHISFNLRSEHFPSGHFDPNMNSLPSPSVPRIQPNLDIKNLLRQPQDNLQPKPMHNYILNQPLTSSGSQNVLDYDIDGLRLKQQSEQINNLARRQIPRQQHTIISDSVLNEHLLRRESSVRNVNPRTNAKLLRQLDSRNSEVSSFSVVQGFPDRIDRPRNVRREIVDFDTKLENDLRSIGKIETDASKEQSSIQRMNSLVPSSADYRYYTDERRFSLSNVAQGTENSKHILTNTAQQKSALSNMVDIDTRLNHDLRTIGQIEADLSRERLSFKIIDNFDQSSTGDVLNNKEERHLSDSVQSKNIRRMSQEVQNNRNEDSQSNTLLDKDNHRKHLQNNNKQDDKLPKTLKDRNNKRKPTKTKAFRLVKPSKSSTKIRKQTLSKSKQKYTFVQISPKASDERDSKKKLTKTQINNKVFEKSSRGRKTINDDMKPTERTKSDSYDHKSSNTVTDNTGGHTILQKENQNEKAHVFHTKEMLETHPSDDPFNLNDNVPNNESQEQHQPTLPYKNNQETQSNKVPQTSNKVRQVSNHNQMENRLPFDHQDNNQEQEQSNVTHIQKEKNSLLDLNNINRENNILNIRHNDKVEEKSSNMPIGEIEQIQKHIDLIKENPKQEQLNNSHNNVKEKQVSTYPPTASLKTPHHVPSQSVETKEKSSQQTQEVNNKNQGRQSLNASQNGNLRQHSINNSYIKSRQSQIDRQSSTTPKIHNQESQNTASANNSERELLQIPNGDKVGEQLQTFFHTNQEIFHYSTPNVTQENQQHKHQEKFSPTAVAYLDSSPNNTTYARNRSNSNGNQGIINSTHNENKRRKSNNNGVMTHTIIQIENERRRNQTDRDSFNKEKLSPMYPHLDTSENKHIHIKQIKNIELPINVKLSKSDVSTGSVTLDRKSQKQSPDTNQDRGLMHVNTNQERSHPQNDNQKKQNSLRNENQKMQIKHISNIYNNESQKYDFNNNFQKKESDKRQPQTVAAMDIQRKQQKTAINDNKGKTPPIDSQKNQKRDPLVVANIYNQKKQTPTSDAHNDNKKRQSTTDSHNDNQNTRQQTTHYDTKLSQPRIWSQNENHKQQLLMTSRNKNKERLSPMANQNSKKINQSLSTIKDDQGRKSWSVPQDKSQRQRRRQPIALQIENKVNETLNNNNKEIQPLTSTREDSQRRQLPFFPHEGNKERQPLTSPIRDNSKKHHPVPRNDNQRLESLTATQNQNLYGQSPVAYHDGSENKPPPVTPSNNKERQSPTVKGLQLLTSHQDDDQERQPLTGPRYRTKKRQLSTISHDKNQRRQQLTAPLDDSRNKQPQRVVRNNTNKGQSPTIYRYRNQRRQPPTVPQDDSQHKQPSTTHNYDIRESHSPTSFRIKKRGRQPLTLPDDGSQYKQPPTAPHNEIIGRQPLTTPHDDSQYKIPPTAPHNEIIEIHPLTVPHDDSQYKKPPTAPHNEIIRRQPLTTPHDDSQYKQPQTAPHNEITERQPPTGFRNRIKAKQPLTTPHDGSQYKQSPTAPHNEIIGRQPLTTPHDDSQYKIPPTAPHNEIIGRQPLTTPHDDSQHKQQPTAPHNEIREIQSPIDFRNRNKGRQPLTAPHDDSQYKQPPPARHNEIEESHPPIDFRNRNNERQSLTAANDNIQSKPPTAPHKEIKDRWPSTGFRNRNNERQLLTAKHDDNQERQPPDGFRNRNKGRQPLTAPHDDSQHKQPPTAPHSDIKERQPPTGFRNSNQRRQPLTAPHDDRQDKQQPTAPNEETEESHPPIDFRNRNNERQSLTAKHDDNQERQPQTGFRKRNKGRQPFIAPHDDSQYKQPPTALHSKIKERQPPTGFRNSNQRRQPLTAPHDDRQDKHQPTAPHKEIEESHPPIDFRNRNNERQSLTAANDNSQSKPPTAPHKEIKDRRPPTGFRNRNNERQLLTAKHDDNQERQPQTGFRKRNKGRQPFIAPHDDSQYKQPPTALHSEIKERQPPTGFRNSNQRTAPHDDRQDKQQLNAPHKEIEESHPPIDFRNRNNERQSLTAANGNSQSKPPTALHKNFFFKERRPQTGFRNRNNGRRPLTAPHDDSQGKQPTAPHKEIKERWPPTGFRNRNNGKGH